MISKEKAQIYRNVWSCAYRRRHDAKMKGDWTLYDREQKTILMCLNMKDAKWWKFEGEK